MEAISIIYKFKLPIGIEECFKLDIHPEKIELIKEATDSAPDWAALDFKQCTNCTLDSQTHRFCPLALRLAPIVERFQNIISYEELDVEIVMEHRRTFHRTSAQRGLSSLMGLVMATSGCPHTVFFKPMARFHLPLASEEETIYRAASMYLLAQYFHKKSGGDPDFQLRGLKQIYMNLQKVNRSVAERLRAAAKTDSSVNAVIMLDMYAKAVPYVIEESIEEIQYLFKAYMEPKGADI